MKRAVGGGLWVVGVGLVLLCWPCFAQSYGRGNATALQGLPVQKALACSDTDVLTWVAADGQFECGAAGGGIVTPVTVTEGGTGANMSATGGSHYIVRQNSSGGVFTASVLAALDLPGTLASLGQCGFGAGYSGLSFTSGVACTSTTYNILSGTGDPTLYYNVPTGNVHAFRVNSTNVLTLSATTATFAGTITYTPSGYSAGNVPCFKTGGVIGYAVLTAGAVGSCN